MNITDTGLARVSTVLTAPTARYDNVSILLHWLPAALIVLLWIVAQVIDDFARGTPRMVVRSVHVALGVALAVLIVARLAWRAHPGRRAPLAVAGVLGAIEWFGNALLILAALHAAAALFHRFVLKDDVLRRMLRERVR